MQIDQKFLKVGAGAVVAGGLLLLIFNPVAGLVGAIVGGCAVAYFLGKSRGENPVDIVQEAVNAVAVPDHKARINAAEESLLGLEVELSLDNPSSDIAQAVRSLSDKLLVGVTPINEQFPNEEITYEVTQMAIEHFPGRVRSFLALNTDVQANRKDEFLTSLADMQAIVDSVHGVLNNAALTTDKRNELLSQIKYRQNL